MAKIRKICLLCHTEYFVKPSDANQSKYCSRLCQCRAIAPRGEKSHLWTGGMVEVKCQSCGKVFTTKKSNLKRGGKFCSRECTIRGRRDYHGPNNPSWRNRQVERICENCGKVFIARKSLVEQGRGRFCSQKCVRSSKWWCTLQAQRLRETEMMEKIAKGLQSKPNKLETKLQNLLSTYFPKQWEYNRGQVILNGLIPDFINVDGQKAVIEVFGEYWHTGRVKWHQTELGRVMAYNSLGFRCLVIWGSGLKDENSVVLKIKRFTEGK